VVGVYDTTTEQDRQSSDVVIWTDAAAS